MEEKDTLSKLMSLSKEELAEALYALSCQNQRAQKLVERLTSDKKRNAERFLTTLNDYGKDRRFIDWRHSHEFCNELRDLLSDLEASVDLPEDGINFIVKFFEIDTCIMEMCDDSSGVIGSFFNGPATEIFHKYAIDYKNKEKLSEIFLELILDNDYGLRDYLPEKVNEFLPSENIRKIVTQLLKRLGGNELILVKKLARSLKDPILFEKIINKEKHENEDYKNAELGEVWLECEDPVKAITYLERVAEKTFTFQNVDQLLFKAYSKTGDTEKLKKTAWKIFRGSRKKEHFERVAELEVEKDRMVLLREVVEEMMSSKELSYSNMDFLMEIDFFDEAELYLMNRSHDLNGDFYTSLSRWAKIFEKQKRYIATSLIYRALLDSILSRGKSKIYHYGVNYLKKLDTYAPKIQDWQGHIDHEQYLQKIKKDHKLKKSFWGQYI